jgi:hypothetical protein
VVLRLTGLFEGEAQEVEVRGGRLPPRTELSDRGGIAVSAESAKVFPGPPKAAQGESEANGVGKRISVVVENHRIPRSLAG